MFRQILRAPCVVCRGRTIQWLRAYRPRNGLFSASSVGRCLSCGLLQVVPMPALDELDDYYQSQYRAGGAQMPVSPYEEASGNNFRTLSQVECIRGLALKPRSVIDVGCGFGLLLKKLRNVFPEAAFAGIEVSTKCHPALAALDIEVATTSLERGISGSFADRFDLLTCSHVLEHSCAPLTFLDACHTMLRPGGMAMFEVPNCEYEYGSDVPHVLFFTPETLRAAMERSGFSVVWCRACGPSIDRWLPTCWQRARNLVDDFLPAPAARALRAGWTFAQPESKRHISISHAVAAGGAKLKEEALDQAWFLYEAPGVKHGAIRCVAVRKP